MSRNPVCWIFGHAFDQPKMQTFFCQRRWCLAQRDQHWRAIQLLRQFLEHSGHKDAYTLTEQGVLDEATEVTWWLHDAPITRP